VGEIPLGNYNLLFLDLEDTVKGPAHASLTWFLARALKGLGVSVLS
jgi:hypothetical protein